MMSEAGPSKSLLPDENLEAHEVGNFAVIDPKGIGD